MAHVAAALDLTFDNGPAPASQDPAVAPVVREYCRHRPRSEAQSTTVADEAHGLARRSQQPQFSSLSTCVSPAEPSPAVGTSGFLHVEDHSYLGKN